MTITELFTNLLESEAAVSRRVLERVPEGRQDWKPHERSMPMGYLATLVATMPGWIAMMIRQDSLDLNPPGGGGYKPPATNTNRELLAAADAAAAQARDALRSTSDKHLETKWQLLVGGRVVDENPRQVAIASTFTHLGHHRGQLTVYLRLNGAMVPSVYGPSADDRTFG
ncbi:MAG: hypothetical protein DMF78_00655 [Acidobacteria bacterium]|nr:MAG: hypothetical protein DMF78_00655 [Acidobacteriota bacterium]